MLPGKERLRRSSLFQRAYTARKTTSTPLVTLYVVPKTGKPPAGARGGGAAMPVKHSENGAETQVKARTAARMPLVGFVIAKKVCKSACARNRTKRRLREAYRLLRQDQSAEALSLSQWYAIVWVMHEKALGSTWQEIRQTVSDCLQRADFKYGVGARTKKDDRLK